MSPPEDAVDEAERLTRRALEATDDDEAAAARRRRDDLLAEYGYLARERQGDDGTVLVVYPDDWMDDGVVRTGRIDDLERAVERPLDGPGGGDGDWEVVDEHNRDVAQRVADAHGPVHGANASAFADFMSNHYAEPVEAATPRIREEFLEEYFPRNAWPSDRQRAVVEQSLDLVRRASEDGPRSRR